MDQEPQGARRQQWAVGRGGCWGEGQRGMGNGDGGSHDSYGYL